MCINRHKKVEFKVGFDGEGRSSEILGYATEVAAADSRNFYWGAEDPNFTVFFFLSLIFGVLLR